MSITDGQLAELERLRAEVAELRPALACLTELVRLKSLSTALESHPITIMEIEQYNKIRGDYYANKHVAWAEARRLVALFKGKV